MKINKEKFVEYLQNEDIMLFESTGEYLKFINDERKLFYSYEYPNDFTTLEEAKQLGWKYQLEYNGKIYWILYECCLDLYEDE